jgi:hypothetical protein
MIFRSSGAERAGQPCTHVPQKSKTSRSFVLARNDL